MSPVPAGESDWLELLLGMRQPPWPDVASCVKRSAGRVQVLQQVRDGGLAAKATSAVSLPRVLRYPKHLAELHSHLRASLEGERKQVTVLFADLKGSMELLADRDPEEARKLLDPVLERMMEAVHRYEGTVNQVMGDGIMALFGAPLAHEDHAVRGVLRRAPDAGVGPALRGGGCAARTASTVQIRVGLNSGEVVVRSIGSDLRMDYTAVGQTTHLAARMEQLATPGTTRLTARHARARRGLRRRCRPLGPVPDQGAGRARRGLRARRRGRRARRGCRRRGAGLHALRRARRRDGAAAPRREQARRGMARSSRSWASRASGSRACSTSSSTRIARQGWLVLESGSVSYGKATAVPAARSTSCARTSSIERPRRRPERSATR